MQVRVGLVLIRCILCVRYVCEVHVCMHACFYNVTAIYVYIRQCTLTYLDCLSLDCVMCVCVYVYVCMYSLKLLSVQCMYVYVDVYACILSNCDCI